MSDIEYEVEARETLQHLIDIQPNTSETTFAEILQREIDKLGRDYASIR